MRLNRSTGRTLSSIMHQIIPLTQWASPLELFHQALSLRIRLEDLHSVEARLYERSDRREEGAGHQGRARRWKS